MSNRFSRLLSRPIPGATVASFLHEQNGHAINAATPNHLLKPHKALMATNQFAVGNSNSRHSGWRIVTSKDINNKVFCNKILKDHEDNGGWLILDKIDPNGLLGVQNGTLRINYQLIICSKQSPENIYSAMNAHTKTTWLEHIPGPDVMWQVSPAKTREYPCLFAKTTLNGGFKRSRRHKQSKHARKHKRCTKKH